MKRKLLKQFLMIIGMTLSGIMISLPGFSQTGKITGKVSGKDDGAPLPGVTVKIKGTTEATGTKHRRDLFHKCCSGKYFDILFYWLRFKRGSSSGIRRT
jgi:hypothetical protein